MTPSLRLLAYALTVIAAAVLGGSIPLWSRSSARRLEFFLAGSAGVMLGVLGGHLLPEAFVAGSTGAWAIIAGFVFMLLVERFILPHALHAPQVADEHAHCDPAVERDHVRRDAAGLGAFIGLALHTMGDGLALGAVSGDAAVAPFVLLAIVAHKIPSAFALGSILVRAKAERSRVLLASAALGAMVGVGALLFLVLRAATGLDARVVTPYAVGFSAGSFLHVAVTDLLPDLHHKGAEKRALLASFLGGLAVMIVISLLIRE